MTTDGEKKPKKTRDKFQIIAEVVGIVDTMEKFALTLKESDSSQWDWRAFHASEYQGKVENGKVYQFKVSLAHEEGRQYPYRNLDGLIGPAVMPASGEMTSYRTSDGGAAGSAPRANGGGNFTPEAKIIERKSIEASQALMIQVDLLKAGFTIEEIPDTLDKMIENAKAITTYYEGRRPELVAPVAPALSEAKPATTPRETKAPDNIEHIGNFLTYCHKRYKLTRANVEAITGDLEDITEWADLVFKVDEEIAMREKEMAKAAEAA